MDGGKVDLADVVRVAEAEGGFGLVDGDLARDLGDVAVEGAADVVVVAKDERLFGLEAYGDDIPSSNHLFI